MGNCRYCGQSFKKSKLDVDGFCEKCATYVSRFTEYKILSKQIIKAEIISRHFEEQLKDYCNELMSTQNEHDIDMYSDLRDTAQTIILICNRIISGKETDHIFIQKFITDEWDELMGDFYDIDYSDMDAKTQQLYYEIISKTSDQGSLKIGAKPESSLRVFGKDEL